MKNANNGRSGLGVGYVCLVFPVSDPLFMYVFGGGAVGGGGALPGGTSLSPWSVYALLAAEPPVLRGMKPRGRLKVSQRRENTGDLKLRLIQTIHLRFRFIPIINMWI